MKPSSRTRSTRRQSSRTRSTRTRSTRRRSSRKRCSTTRSPTLRPATRSRRRREARSPSPSMTNWFRPAFGLACPAVARASVPSTIADSERSAGRVPVRERGREHQRALDLIRRPRRMPREDRRCDSRDDGSSERRSRHPHVVVRDGAIGEIALERRRRRDGSSHPPAGRCDLRLREALVRGAPGRPRRCVVVARGCRPVRGIRADRDDEWIVRGRVDDAARPRVRSVVAGRHDDHDSVEPERLDGVVERIARRTPNHRRSARGSRRGCCTRPCARGSSRRRR